MSTYRSSTTDYLNKQTIVTAIIRCIVVLNILLCNRCVRFILKIVLTL